MSVGETDWENIGRLVHKRAELGPTILRGMLGVALRRRGFGSVVFEEPREPKKDGNERAATLITIEIIWGLTASAIFTLQSPLYFWPLIFLGVIFFLWLAVKILGSSPMLAALLTALWVIAAVVTLSEGNLLAHALAYFVPLLLIVFAYAGRWVLGLRDLGDIAVALAGIVKSAPLLAPIVVIVLFLPALSRDVWEVAAQLSLTSIVLTGVLSVGILLVVVWRQLGSEVETTLRERAGALCDLGNRGQRTRAALRANLDKDEGPELLEDFTDEELEHAWPLAGEEYAPYLHAASGATFRRPLLGRLLLTVTLVTAILFSYIYLLTSAVIAGSLAERWSASTPPSTELHPLGISVTLHGGPYLTLAVLLGLVASATFLAFVLVEERFAAALTGALLRDPGERFLLLALPYLALREHQLSASVAPESSKSSGSG